MSKFIHYTAEDIQNRDSVVNHRLTTATVGNLAPRATAQKSLIVRIQATPNTITEEFSVDHLRERST